MSMPTQNLSKGLGQAVPRVPPLVPRAPKAKAKAKLKIVDDSGKARKNSERQEVLPGMWKVGTSVLTPTWLRPVRRRPEDSAELAECGGGTESA